ncbi:MAG TPA: hypothetical protein VHE30_15840 [Polyangiaceae bacterium]|nr:hypothetical protein [Polyangiaceae bacterium]
MPDGLRSFPGCSVRGTVLEPYVRDFKSLATEPSLPEAVADLFAGKSTAPWVAETTFQVAYLAVRDLAFRDDAAFHRWVFAVNAELLDGPLIRHLVRLVSPTLVVLGAAKRWSHFHQGSDLVPGKVEAVGGRTLARSELRYPIGLFTECFLAGLEQAFLAAVTKARGKEPKVVVLRTEPGRTTYEASFRS